MYDLVSEAQKSRQTAEERERLAVLTSGFLQTRSSWKKIDSGHCSPGISGSVQP